MGALIVFLVASIWFLYGFYRVLMGLNGVLLYGC